MKTTTNYTSVKKIAKIILTISLLTKIASAQNCSSYMGIRTSVSGNGLSPTNALMTGMKISRCEMELGANVQERHSHFSGLQMSFAYYLLDDCSSKAKLSAFVNCSYNFAAYLSQGTINREKQIAPESTINFQNLLLKTVETHGGFALHVQHTKYMSSFYAIGFGAYQTIGSKAVCSQMYREGNAVSLYLSVGIKYSLK